MTALQTVSRRLAMASLAVTSTMLAVSPAAAVDLPPGAAVILPGSVPPGGAVLHDRFLDFEIRDLSDGTVLYAGTVRDRVVRLRALVRDGLDVCEERLAHRDLLPSARRPLLMRDSESREARTEGPV